MRGIVVAAALGLGAIGTEAFAADMPQDTHDVRIAQIERPQLNRPVRPPIVLPGREPEGQPLDSIKPSATQREALQRARPRPMSGELPRLDDFPYFADDFADGEFIFNGKAVHNPDDPMSTWQQFAYDLGTVRQHADGVWRDFKPTINWKNPKNSDYYIDGKPVHAVSEGVVVHCWRNAPENPRPFTSELDSTEPNLPLADQTWLHDDTRAGKVHGSGNFIMVREDNGNHVHYAHGRPDTVPSRLCPHNGTHLNPGTWEADSAVPASQQVRVKRGDFLFLTGNTGTSSAPHLHLDRTEADKATSVRLRFRNGLAKQLDKDSLKTKSEKWSSFAGQPIPPGPVIVWSPRRLGAEYARHAFPASEFQDWFEHLGDSGYWPVWLDTYRVGGKTFMNHVWRPAKHAWWARHLIDAQSLKNEMKKAEQEGFTPVFIDSTTVGAAPRYTVIFAKGQPGEVMLRPGLTGPQNDAAFIEARQKGLYPVNVSVVSIAGMRFYTVLYRTENIGKWEILASIPEANYPLTLATQRAQGRKPVYLNAYMHGGKPFISAIFASAVSERRKDKHALSGAAYQQEFGLAHQAGMLTRAVTSIDGAQREHRFAASWWE
jgi:hypothetical protein